VDVQRVRLTGTDHPEPGVWLPGMQGDTLRARWLERLTRATDLVGTGVGNGALLDSLLAWRVGVAAGSALVTPLDSAIDLVRAGRDPRSMLQRMATSVTGPWRSAEGVEPLRDRDVGGGGGGAK
jgi:hypothetical protein